MVERKVFAEDLNIKMMSEDEVRTEKLNIQYQKMLYYHEKIVRWIQQSCKQAHNLDVLGAIWKKHFDHLIHSAIYPAHRYPLLGLIRTTCQEFYNDCKKEVKQETHIFYKFSQFLGEFFVMKGAGITPSIVLM